LLLTAAEIHGLGLGAAQGLVLSETHDWDLSDRTRELASASSNVRADAEHDLGRRLCRDLARSQGGQNRGDEGGRCGGEEAQGELPVDDALHRTGMCRPMDEWCRISTCFRSKSQRKANATGIMTSLLATVPGETAYLIAANSGCPLTK
jgi:branched-chain amino acid transport system substrate-binding protein